MSKYYPLWRAGRGPLALCVACLAGAASLCCMQRLQADYRPRSDDPRRIRGGVSRAVDDPAGLQSAAPGTRRSPASGREHSKTGGTDHATGRPGCSRKTGRRSAPARQRKRPSQYRRKQPDAGSVGNGRIAKFIEQIARLWRHRQCRRVGQQTQYNAAQGRLLEISGPILRGAAAFMTLFDLSGRVAIVTGGNGGIGLGMAGGLAAAGARIVVAARDRDKAEKAIAELGQESSFIPFDAADESSCRGVVAATLDRFGRLDILVNNAGMSIRKPAQEYTAAEWHSVLDTNLTGAFICSQAAYPVMKQAGGGKIINIGSMFSLFGAPYAVPYSVSKGGLLQLTKSLAAAWAAGQRSGQCGAAGLDRHRSDPGCAAAGRGLARASFGAHPGRRAGAIRTTSPGSPYSSPPPPRISSPALRSRSMAASHPPANRTYRGIG